MVTNFKEFALAPALQTSLENMKFETPTPIQALAIPFALEGRDILGSAQTGTGKTAAFCVPMINFLIKNPTAHALVMLPTRELATQVHDVARKMIGYDTKDMKTALLIGGEPIGKQYAQLQRRPRLIVGTPGRINDHLRSNGDLVDRVAFVVLDEADRMLDMGFMPQIDSILSETALERQTLMFSATFPDNIVKFSKQYLQNPERVSAGVQSKPGENIIQESMNVPQEQKYDELMLQLQKREGSVIVFVRTQHGADKLSAKLNKDEHTSEAIHGGLRQRQRDKVIGLFRKSAIRVLVATDVAARGLDVPHIEHVVNFDLPQVAEDYIHRIGRTARGGAKGHAVSFISPGEKHLWRDIERMLNPNDPGSEIREGGRGGTKKQFGGGKKFGGKPSFGGERSGERNYGPKKDGFNSRKPFGRSDRQDRPDRAEKPGWNPAADFDRSESRTEGNFDSRPPRREYSNDRPQRSEGQRFEGNRDGGFKKPYVKREDNFASNPDAYKRTNSGERKEGGFKKPFNRDGASSDRPRSNYGDRPQRSEGNRDSAPRANYGDRPQRSEGNRDGGFKKPYNRDAAQGDRPRSNDSRPFNRDGGQQPRSEGGYKKPFNRDGASADRPRSNYGDRPQRDGDRKEGGFKKPYNRDGAQNDRPRSNNGGEKRPFVKREGGSSDNRGNSAPRSEGFRKEGGARSDGNAPRSKSRSY